MLLAYHLKRILSCALLFGAWAISPCAAGEPVKFLSLEEFSSLAQDLAPKVDLFANAWQQDPKAEFFGGTSRDYLFWLKSQFRDAKNKTDAAQIAEAPSCAAQAQKALLGLASTRK